MAATADIFAPQVVGTPTIATSEPVEMLGPDGEVKLVQGRHAGTMSALGYQRVTPEIRQQLDDKARLGGTIGEMAAAGLGFARGSTLGLSDLAARGAENAGILPEGTTEDIRKLKEINPNASLAGELTSFITPGLGAVKALGTAGKVAKGMGAAQAAVGGVGNALGKAAAKVAGEKLGRYVAPAVRTAAEAAIFQAGQNISENVLANKELTAEAVLANTGEAAILGGGLGIGIPLALRGAQKAAAAALDSQPAQWMATKSSKALAKFLDPQRAAQLYSGSMSMPSLFRETATGKAFKSAVKDLWDEGFYKGGEVALDEASGRLVQTARGKLLSQPEMFERLIATEKQAGSALGNVMSQADDAATAAGLRRSVDDMRTMQERVNDAVAGGKNPSAPELTLKSLGWSPEDSEIVNGIVGKWRKTSQITPKDADRYLNIARDISSDVNRAETIGELHNIRRGLDARIGGENFRKLTNEDVELVKDIRGIVSRKITTGLEELEERGVIAKSDAWRRLNKLYGSLAEIKPHLDFQTARANSNVNVGGLRWRDLLATATGSSMGGAAFGPVGAIAGGSLGLANRALQTDTGLLMRAQLGERMASIGWLQKSTEAAEKNVAKSVSGFLKSVDAAALGGAISRPPQLAGALVASDALTPDVRQGNDAQWFADTSGQIARVMADPESFAEEQGARLGAIVDHAPQTADAIISKQLQIYSYLGEVMPKNPGRPTSILAPTWRPSEYQINEFRDVVRVARKPLSILQDLQHGTATRAQTKAIQALYPSLYEKMLEQVREQLSKPNASLPYEKELRLGVLFPGAVPSMTGAFILSMSTGAAEAEEPSTRSGYRAGGAGKMKVGTRTSTKVDALSER